MYFPPDQNTPPVQPQGDPTADILRKMVLGGVAGAGLGRFVGGGLPGSIVGGIGGLALSNPTLRDAMMGGVKSLFGSIFK